jgi:hypothetical protein
MALQIAPNGSTDYGLACFASGADLRESTPDEQNGTSKIFVAIYGAICGHWIKEIIDKR